jgi:hypothetical protein
MRDDYTIARNEVAQLRIDTLAQSEAELRECVASREADIISYRELAQEAIQALHHVTRERDRLRLAARRDVVDIMGRQTDVILALRRECDDLRWQLRARQAAA